MLSAVTVSTALDTNLENRAIVPIGSILGRTEEKATDADAEGAAEGKAEDVAEEVTTDADAEGVAEEKAEGVIFFIQRNTFYFGLSISLTIIYPTP